MYVSQFLLLKQPPLSSSSPIENLVNYEYSGKFDKPCANTSILPFFLQTLLISLSAFSGSQTYSNPKVSTTVSNESSSKGMALTFPMIYFASIKDTGLVRQNSIIEGLQSMNVTLIPGRQYLIFREVPTQVSRIFLPSQYSIKTRLYSGILVVRSQLSSVLSSLKDISSCSLNMWDSSIPFAISC